MAITATVLVAGGLHECLMPRIDALTPAQAGPLFASRVEPVPF